MNQLKNNCTAKDKVDVKLLTIVTKIGTKKKSEVQKEKKPATLVA